jgi:NAD-dependent SIR2 family protein deacetylase
MEKNIIKNMPQQQIEAARDILRNASALIISAGAGIGVDSGLPDFRGDEGFWKAYPPLKKLNISFIEMANPKWFLDNPQLAWGFYGHRTELYRNTIPHKGFEMLYEYAQSLNNDYFIFTSNVDGQFQKAGFNSEKIHEIHGSIHTHQCSEHCNQEVWPADEIKFNIDKESFLATGELPYCPNCGAIARPNLLMFGDWQWIDTLYKEQSERMYAWLTKISRYHKKLAIIEIGAGKAIPSVRQFSHMLVKNYNASLIRINPRNFDVPTNEIGLEMGAYDGISAILQDL